MDQNVSLSKKASSSHGGFGQDIVFESHGDHDGFFFCASIVTFLLHVSDLSGIAPLAARELSMLLNSCVCESC